MKTTLLPSLLAGIALATFSNAAIQTTFVDVDNFTDFSISGGREDQARGVFERELARDGRLQSAVGENRTLELTITNVDMAGEIEPWRDRSHSEIRYVTSIYPPRMSFSYVLRDADGKEIASGEENLSDLSFDFGISAFGRQHSFYYELNMLDDWARLTLPRDSK